MTKLFERLRKRARKQGVARESLFEALKKAQEQRSAARQPDAPEPPAEETPAEDEINRKDA